nr:ribonuclease H-like domain-containing protein [Tanacetum cinerariifolium]
MGHFTRECRAPRSQDKGRRDNYRQGSKVEEQTPKALMAIDGVGWDWSFMVNEQEDHALVADEEAPTEFSLMAQTSAKSEVEGRLLEFKNQEIKFCEKIRVLEFNIKGKTNIIEYLTKELENLKNVKEGLESKLIGFQSASKDLDSLLESQRLDKNKEGLGYSVVPPPAQVYSPPKKDLSWTSILEFADDTITDYSRPSPTIESTSDDAQNKNPSILEIEASPSTISSKPFIKFVKVVDPLIVAKSDKKETVRKNFLKYAEQYRKPSKTSNVTWTFFLKTKDETSGILRNFITEIENLKELRVKIIRCDNGGAFRNKEMSDFCSKKGKFKAKRDEGYFLGYSMSSKAFRVFNKRTKRVEENLLVDFLENKPIEKGAGPNWLFNIDSLTNSINYVPVVVAGTNFINFSGTKEAGGQDVKKDVSSLRYIVLPNWFHEAHLESSTSNDQDTCSADAPESSGNSNPTATSTNPSANHMETLAVETLIPT